MAKQKLTKAEYDALMRMQPHIADLVERCHAVGVSCRWFMQLADIQYKAIRACEEGMRERLAREAVERMIRTNQTEASK